MCCSFISSINIIDVDKDEVCHAVFIGFCYVSAMLPAFIILSLFNPTALYGVYIFNSFLVISNATSAPHWSCADGAQE